MAPKPIIHPRRIHDLLKEGAKAPRSEVERILEKALLLKGLELGEVAALMTVEDEGMLRRLFETAHRVKEEIYGDRLVLFAPLYVSNHCANDCLYCGFRRSNPDLARRTLTLDEVRRETRLILEQGHKRILMLMGEHPTACTFGHFLGCIDAAYSAEDAKGSRIRRVNVEIAPLSSGELRRLSEHQIGTYTVFQETYHRPTYRRMHPSGRKSDYLWRLEVMDRALSSGLHDVGIGALFGLYDHRFEVLALVEHARHLDEELGVGPHTISVPRIEPASHAPASLDVPRPVSDLEFMRIVAVLRCAVPSTGIILSTREPPELRTRLFDLGVSQISAGSRTEVGGYAASTGEPVGSGQFSLNDTRSTGEVIRSVIEQGYVPSFCTGCYRLGRVGKDFMELAKPGLIKLHCLPNALTTLKEYLVDYADPQTRRLGEGLIARQLALIPSAVRRRQTEEFLGRIERGERDLYV